MGRIESSAKIAASLFHKSHGVDRMQMRKWYISTATTEPTGPFCTEDSLISEITDTLKKHPNWKQSIHDPSPYWNKTQRYNPYDVFCSVIQLFDDHNEPLPQTTLPPTEDIQKYSNFIIQHNGKVTYAEQFDKLLEITDDNLLGAANVGFLAARIFARGADSRAYPHIQVEPHDLIRWAHKIPHIEVSSGKWDSSGDNYYFWSHIFAACVYNSINSPTAKRFDELFKNGTQIMVTVRKHIAKQPTISEHKEASLIGRNIGIAICALAEESEQ